MKIRSRVAAVAPASAIAVVSVLALAVPAANAHSRVHKKHAPIYGHIKSGTNQPGCTQIYQNRVGPSNGKRVGRASVAPAGNGNVRVTVHLLHGKPNTTYSFSDACVRMLGTFKTNKYGAGSGTVLTPQDGQTHWGIDGGPASNEQNPKYYFESPLIIS
jgi:hypothetical protein